MKIIVYFSLLATFVLGISACKSKSYEQLLAEAKVSSERHDPLFLDFKFGQSRDEFFSSCKKFNQEGLLTNGPRNMTALFTINDAGGKPVEINFYPDFCKNKICVMRFSFNYSAWSPWGHEYKSEKLLPEAVKWIEHQFQTDLKKMPLKGKPYLVAFDGSREIRVWLEDTQYVSCYVYDHSANHEALLVEPDSTVRKPAWFK